MSWRGNRSRGRASSSPLPPLPTGDVTATQTEAGITVHGKGSSIRISSRTGLPDSFVVDGQELLVQPMRWNFWRALTDNDEGWKVDEKLGAWRDAGKTAVVQSSDADDGQGRTPRGRRRGDDSESEGTHYGPAYRRGGRGTEDGSEFRGSQRTRWKPDLPRLGIQFAIPRSYDRVAWYGRGPHENYWDRQTSAPIGRYESTVSQWVTPYVRPQENGNRCDVRWLRITNEHGSGLQASAPPDAPLSCQCLAVQHG